MSWYSGSDRMPSTRCRVVCAFSVTMDSVCPSSAFMSVDLPALGRPMMATKPAGGQGVAGPGSEPARAEEEGRETGGPGGPGAAHAAGLLTRSVAGGVGGELGAGVQVVGRTAAVAELLLLLALLQLAGRRRDLAAPLAPCRPATPGG